MYEITIIEKHRNGELLMSHIPVSDDEIVEAAQDVVTQEEKCVDAGILLNYTMYEVYHPDNLMGLYAPAHFLSVKGKA
jgi:hypothetical protein